jgi:hypothetical protein
MRPNSSSAINLFPSAEQATSLQKFLCALVGVQVAPEFVDV